MLVVEGRRWSRWID